jgi:ribosomal protein S18 acetylase RimI-like enzyme
MELRRMYVDPLARRQGIARQMLQFAENECCRRRVKRLELSTAEIQQAALALYRNAGYRLVRVETAEALSNKTVVLASVDIISKRFCNKRGKDAVHGD